MNLCVPWVLADLPTQIGWRPFSRLVGGYLSLPYYRFFTGDYDRNTRHLSMLQHGAYRLLIDAYMANGPLPNDLERLHRICGAFNAEERMAIEVVLVEFFVLQGPTWLHKRCEKEREWQREKSRSAKESIGIRWNYERIYERNTNQIQIQNQRSESEPKPKPNKTLKPKPTKSLDLTPPECIDAKIWLAFEEHRRASRSALSAYGKSLIWKKLLVLQSKGYDPNEILKESITNGWKGVFAPKDRTNLSSGIDAWLADKKGNTYESE